MIKAAGGVIWRRTGTGKPSVLVVHRPKYDDWSFPKGKANDEESYSACAHREVAEETGLECSLDTELLTVEYLDRRDRRKRVRYWAMTATSGNFVANSEVDEIKWLSLSKARKRLSSPRDLEVLDAFEKLVADS